MEVLERRRRESGEWCEDLVREGKERDSGKVEEDFRV